MRTVLERLAHHGDIGVRIGRSSGSHRQELLADILHRRSDVLELFSSFIDLGKSRILDAICVPPPPFGHKKSPADLKRLNEQIHYLGQYLSTKATYKEFLQANNKKIYRSEHQEEIAKYEEAAQFLKRSSPDGTIPTMKDLRAEKEKLLSIRTARYESYAYFKDYYHELQTACQNVDMILETEHTQQHSRTQPKRRHEPSL